MTEKHWDFERSPGNLGQDSPDIVSVTEIKSGDDLPKELAGFLEGHV